MIQTPYFTSAESNVQIITTLQFSLVIVSFCELISAKLSSASESIQPGLINLGRSKFGLKRNQQQAGNSIIIGGYFNSALKSCDKVGGAAVKRKNVVISQITKLCDLLTLQDVWRYQHRNETLFTWR